jgi:hypothetical protein
VAHPDPHLRSTDGIEYGIDEVLALHKTAVVRRSKRSLYCSESVQDSVISHFLSSDWLGVTFAPTAHQTVTQTYCLVVGPTIV